MTFSTEKSRLNAHHFIKLKQYFFLAREEDVGFQNYQMKLKMLSPLPKGNPLSS